MLGNDDTTVAYLGRLKGQPSIVVLQADRAGRLQRQDQLIIAVRSDGRIAGVRVVSHKETPGLGDYIEIAKSKWINGFDGKSLGNPEDSGWKVKKDGGHSTTWPVRRSPRARW